MAPVLAQIAPLTDSEEQRARVRRPLRLQVQALLSAGATQALIHNMSQDGVLIETAAELRVGDTFVVELSEAGDVEATVMWARGRFLGCNFRERVAQAAVSAALLRSPANARLPAQQPLPAPVLELEEAAADDERSRLLLMASLLLGLAIAFAFIVALYSFPFSAD